jgi:hypothetical protein
MRIWSAAPPPSGVPVIAIVPASPVCASSAATICA